MPRSVTKASKPQPVDDETAAALALYNAYLIADREQQAHERAVKRAERAKDEAAAEVRDLNDRKTPAAKMAAAEAKYREAVEALQRLRGGETPAPEDADDADDAAEDKNGANDGDDDTEAEDADGDDDTEAEDADGDDDTEAEDADGDDDTEAEDADGADGDTEAEDADGDDGEAEDADGADGEASVGVEASVGDEDLAGDETAGVAG